MIVAHPPEIFILAGPNGAGKSTSAAFILPHRFQITEFVNADVIQQSLGPATSPVTAGRLMLQRMHELREAGQSFAFETTLAGKSYIPFLLEAQKLGYIVHLTFIALDSPALAQARVALRVRRGGHSIPPEDIDRRYWRGLRNFVNLYCKLVNTWTLCDNSGSSPKLVAQSDPVSGIIVYDQSKYDQIRCAIQRQP